MEALIKFLPQLISIGVVTFIACLSPGPDVTLLIRSSVVYSRKVGVYSFLGINTGALLHILLNILGIAILITKYPGLMKLIKYFGAGYLGYVGILSIKGGWSLYRSKSNISAENDLQPSQNNMTPLSAYKKGFFTNVLNPKALIFFVSIFSTLINASTPKYIFYIAGLEILAIDSIVFLSIVYFLSMDNVRKVFNKYSYLIEVITGILFIFFAINLLIF